MTHKYTEKAEVNFSKLYERILSINNPMLGEFVCVRKMLYELTVQNKPTLIMATGGSKVVAYYLQLILERKGIICEVIEPRDYFYKLNKDRFFNLVVISASGKTNGIKEAFNDFKGKKFLFCEKNHEVNYDIVSWGNSLYEREKSFISLTTSLGPITLLLDVVTSSNLGADEIRKINNKIKELLVRSKRKVDELSVSFRNTNLIQIISGYETRTSCSVLESNLVESGVVPPVIHDKGSYCHGRSNLLFRYPNSHVIYLSHELKDLDNLLINAIGSGYSNLSIFETSDLDEDIFWKEYYLMLQMYFLSKKITDDNEIDLTQPEYDSKLVKKFYNFKGEM